MKSIEYEISNHADDCNCLLKNYKPTSLLTTDYNILSHIVANIIRVGLPKIINASQIGYKKGVMLQKMQQTILTAGVLFF